MASLSFGASFDTTGARPGEASSALGIIDVQGFTRLYERQFHKLGAFARQGLAWLIDFVNHDLSMVDVGQCAYMLATVKHECAETWMPIEEFGKGAGHSYGNAVTVNDANGKAYSNQYYGRGYVQLTWQANYQKLGNAIGIGEELLLHPEQALDPEVSYAIMSLGMRKGSFTPNKKKLDDYINSMGCDYTNARRIINGTDQAARIAGYAINLELILRVSC